MTVMFKRITHPANGESTETHPLTRTVASPSRGWRKWKTSYRLRHGTRSFVSVDPDCTSAVICGDTALLCHLNRGDASSSTALLLRGNKRVQEPSCKKEFEWERRSSLLNSTRGVLGRMSYGKSARGKHLPLLEGRGGGVNVSLQTALCVSAEVFNPRTVPALTELRQKYERVV